MKKYISIALLSLALMSCGSDKKIEGNAKEATIFAMAGGKALNDEWPVYKKAAEDTGLTLVGVASQNQTNERQAFNLMLASKPLPDIISFNIGQELDNLGAQGGLIPLEDLIDKHAPHIKEFFNKYPRFKKDAYSVDGHIYMIPNYSDFYRLRASQAHFIRYDWLEKLNLKVPTTIDEMHDVLVAFRDKDPNGNGKKDEIGIFSRANNIRGVIITLLDIFKATPLWYENEEGRIVYGPAQDNYKEAIKIVAQWYKEGLIDLEIFTRGKSARDYFLSNNLGGFTIDWIGSTSSYNKILKDKIDGFNFSAMLPLVVDGNNKTRISRKSYQGGWGISKDAKDPVTLIKYFDYWYTKEGRRLWNFGIEGDTYTLVDGKPVFTDKVLKDPNGKTALAVLKNTGAQFQLGMFQDADYEYGWATKEAKDTFKLYSDNEVIEEVLPELKYEPNQGSKFVKIDSALRTYIEEKTQSWILGSADVEKEWPAYIKSLKNLGLDEATKIQNEAFKRYNK